jgi:hypothetical protein
MYAPSNVHGGKRKLVRKHEGKRSLQTSGCRWEDNIKNDITERFYEVDATGSGSCSMLGSAKAVLCYYYISLVIKAKFCVNNK